MESNGFIGLSFMKIFGNAGSVFILAVAILMSYVYMCMYVCMYMCVYVCVRACVRVCKIIV